MKKFPLIIFLLSALALFGCAREEGVVDEPSIPEGRTLVATIVQDTTRAAVSETGGFTWSENDAIAVWTTAGRFRTFTLNSGAGTSTAVFVSSDLADDESPTSCAVFPASAQPKLEGTSLSCTIPESSTWDESSTNVLMLATLSEGDEDIQFRHLTAAYRITYVSVPSNAAAFQLEADGKLTGDFTVDISADNPSITSNASGKSTVKYLIPSTSDVMTFTVPIPTGEYTGFTTRLLDSYGNIIADTQNEVSYNGTVTRKSLLLASPYLVGIKLVYDVYQDKDGNALPSLKSNVPAIDKDGNAYLMTSGTDIYKISPAGEILWQKEIGFCGCTGATDRQDTSPSLEVDGSVVYCLGSSGSNLRGSGRLWALNTSDGSEKWYLDASDMISGNGTDALAFFQGQVGIGNNCVFFGYAGSDGTMMSVDKATGKPVAYVSRNQTGIADGTGSWIGPNGNPRGWITISKNGSVAFTNHRGIWMTSQAELESPTRPATDLGLPNVPFAACYGVTWDFKGIYGMSAAFSAPDGTPYFATYLDELTGSNIYQSRIFAGDATKGTGTNCTYPNTTNGFRENDLNTHVWYQHGTVIQDQGGIVIGEDGEVIVSFKSGGSGYPGGIYAVNLGVDGSSTGKLYSYDNDADNYQISGAPAIDNNGFIHTVGSDGVYHIFDPSKVSGKKLPEVFSADLNKVMEYSGIDLGGKQIENVWTSLMIGYDGRMYVGVTIQDTTHFLCLSYPGTTGFSTKTDWPMRGGNPYHTGLQAENRIN